MFVGKIVVGEEVFEMTNLDYPTGWRYASQFFIVLI